MSFADRGFLENSEAWFFDKVMPVTESGCWLWLGAVSTSGYARICTGPVGGKQKQVPMHRWAYEHFIGPIPSGQLVCHSCDVRSCVNPKHLWLGSNKDNNKDMIKKKRGRFGNVYSTATHCAHGHLLDDANTRTYDKSSGDKWTMKQCRACDRERARRARARK